MGDLTLVAPLQQLHRAPAGDQPVVRPAQPGQPHHQGDAQQQGQHAEADPAAPSGAESALRTAGWRLLAREGEIATYAAGP